MSDTIFLLLVITASLLSAFIHGINILLKHWLKEEFWRLILASGFQSYEREMKQMEDKKDIVNNG